MCLPEGPDGSPSALCIVMSARVTPVAKEDTRGAGTSNVLSATWGSRIEVCLPRSGGKDACDGQELGGRLTLG